MATLTLNTSEANQALGINTGNAGVNPAVSPIVFAGPLHTETVLTVSPPLYGGPSAAPIPFVPGIPQAPVNGGYPALPPVAVDTGCDQCSTQTPGAGGATIVPSGQVQPVLKTADTVSGCAVCDRLRALAPWWVWLVLAAVVLYLLNRK